VVFDNYFLYRKYVTINYYYLLKNDLLKLEERLQQSRKYTKPIKPGQRNHVEYKEIHV
jgi:hypothetical protein